MFYTEENLTAELFKDGKSLGEYTSGNPISADGQYRVRVADQAGNEVSVEFTIDKTVSYNINVFDGGLSNSVMATASEQLTVSLTKNGEVIDYALGSAITEPADYVLVLTDAVNNRAEIAFTVIKPVLQNLTHNFDKIEGLGGVTVNGNEHRLNYGTLELKDDGVYEVGVIVGGETYTFKVTIDTLASYTANVHDGGFANSVTVKADENVTVSVTKNGEAFSKELADLCDAYVCDAFGSSHRAHASVAGVTDVVRAKGGECAVGYLMQKEIDFLGNAVENPVRPFVAILGGAKVADKLNVINNLLEKCDTLIIGGGMAFTFLKAQGYEIGKSLVDEEKLDYCKEMMAKAEKLGKKLLLPIDTTIAAGFPNPIDAEIEVSVVDADKIPADMEGLDIGTKTAEMFADAVKSAKTVVWNGPMGVFENPTLAKGTIAVAKSLAETDATTIIGGGDSAAAVNQLGFADKMSHISTGGGASLEFLEGKALPGVVAADDK